MFQESSVAFKIRFYWIKFPEIVKYAYAGINIEKGKHKADAVVGVKLKGTLNNPYENLIVLL